jgi:hypothetical protein
MPPINRSLPITLCWWPRSPAVVVADAECAATLILFSSGTSRRARNP